MKTVSLVIALAIWPMGAYSQDETPKGDAAPGGTPTGVDLLFGVGSRISGGGVTNYKTVSNSVLESTNLGRATPQGLVGLSFPFCGSDAQKQAEKWFCGNTVGHRLSAYVSTQFGSGADHVLTGYTLGLGIHISSVLHALVGLSIAPINEPSPGFRNAAAQYVKSHAGDYPGVDPAALAANSSHAFDGFQFIVPPASGTAGSGTPIYPGDVLTTHYRPGLFIGVAFPLSLKAQLDK